MLFTCFIECGSEDIQIFTQQSHAAFNQIQVALIGERFARGFAVDGTCVDLAHVRQQQGGNSSVPLERFALVQELVVFTTSLLAVDEKIQHSLSVEHGFGNRRREEELRPVEDESFESFEAVYFWLRAREEVDDDLGDAANVGRHGGNGAASNGTEFGGEVGRQLRRLFSTLTESNETAEHSKEDVGEH